MNDANLEEHIVMHEQMRLIHLRDQIKEQEQTIKQLRSDKRKLVRHITDLVCNPTKGGKGNE
jgi:hypothetical protein